MNTQLVIAFYNKLLSLSLADALVDLSEFSTIHQVEDFNGLTNVLQKNTCEYLLIDEFFTDKFKLAAILDLCGQGRKTKIIMLAEKKEVSYIKEMFAKGISAYISPNTTMDELRRAIKALADNKQFVSTDVLVDFVIKESLIYDANKSEVRVKGGLTTREKDVLRELGREKKPNEIAQELNMSVFTVNFHLKNLRRKLNSKNTVGLIRYSMQNNKQ